MLSIKDMSGKLKVADGFFRPNEGLGRKDGPFILVIFLFDENRKHSTLVSCTMMYSLTDISQHWYLQWDILPCHGFFNLLVGTDVQVSL